MQKIIEKIRNAIQNTEFAGKSYIAGGFVRDQIMGNKTDDLDITVELPQGGIKLANFLYNKGLSSKPVLYQKFGTALSIIDNYRIEFVMTRNESYKKGCRKPETSSGTINEDVIRRDFTINSLIMDIMTGNILDITGKGIDDINKGIIRATSDPDFIFSDDPLRILRAVRFSNRYHFNIEENTKKGIIADKDQLTNISWERKRDEFEKILLSDSPGKGLNLLFQFGLMKFIIPELEIYYDKIHFEYIQKLPSALTPRLAMLLENLYSKDNKSLVKNILSRLKFSRKIINDCMLFIEFYKIILELLKKNSDDLPLRLFYYHHKNKYLLFSDYLNKFLSESDGYKILEKSIYHVYQHIGQNEYPVTGNILKKHFDIPQCRKVGEYYQMGLVIWLRNPELSKSDILSSIENKCR